MRILITITRNTSVVQCQFTNNRDKNQLKCFGPLQNYNDNAQQPVRADLRDERTPESTAVRHNTAAVFSQ